MHCSVHATQSILSSISWEQARDGGEQARDVPFYVGGIMENERSHPLAESWFTVAQKNNGVLKEAECNQRYFLS